MTRGQDDGAGSGRSPGRSTGYRCPHCGSRRADADEARSAWEFTFMVCPDCGEGELVDSWTRDLEWRDHGGGRSSAEAPSPTSPAPQPAGARGERLGCARCADEDAEAAWVALQQERVDVMVQESHFSIRATRCACGQAFVVVFTECIDWSGGDDDQTWLALPVHGVELAELRRADEAELRRRLPELGRGRRLLVRSFPTGASLRCRWHAGGLVIGPHD